MDHVRLLFLRFSTPHSSGFMRIKSDDRAHPSGSGSSLRTLLLELFTAPSIRWLFKGPLFLDEEIIK
jgi:hypothetical protein